MRLAEHLARSGETQADFARRSGIGQATVSRILAGAGTRLATAQKIVDATAGKVRLQDLLAPASARERIEPAGGARAAG